MDLKLAGRRVLITGGSKGIGAACARVFLAEGCSVVLVARDAARLAATAAALGEANRVTTHAADLSVSAEREAIAAAFPDIDILVNNAGAIPAGGLLDLSMESWEQAWALKVMGYIHLTKLYLGQMKERGAGVIVNVIGGAGRSPRYDYVCGGTGNAALMAFTGAVGGRSPEWGVRVFGINPAQTRTDRIISLSKTRAKIKLGDEERWEEMLTGLPFDRLIEPEEIANAAAFLSSPACGYVSGTVLDVDGGGAFRG
ncbi:3-oxoacyl-[acyl-carrier protein] reductase [Bosea sp. OAE506]|uniref:short-chain dehydrogenase/reductase n=1 Tax=Bosea sp. OAE506 TaxID=2663870 RepID=UPI00178AD82D